MSGKSEVSQKITLDAKQYRDENKRVAAETKQAYIEIRKEQNDAQGSFRNYTDSIKKNGMSLVDSLKSMGKAFAKNLALGAVGGTVVTGVDAMRAGMRSAVATSISFSDSLAKLAARADLSQSKIAKLREQIFTLGKTTGADLGSITAGANTMFGATGNVDQAMSVMEPISKAAAVNGGNADEIAAFVADRLKGENKEINLGNVKDLLGGLVLAQRGGEFNSIQESMTAFKGLPEGVQSRTGMSNRDLAALLAGATRAGGNRDTGVAAAQAIAKLSQSGFAGDAVLGGILGIGSFKKGGKFDMGQLTKAAGHVGALGGSEQQRMAMLSTAGLSEQEAQGLLSILEHIQKFTDGVKKVESDTKSFDQTMDESADSLGTGLKKLNNEIVGGFSDIFGGLEGVAKKAVGGHFWDAAKSLPGAAGQMIEGVAAHPALATGALLSTATAGLLMKKLGLGGGAASLAAGVSKGKALQAGAGVTPVYVVNMGEMGDAGAKGLPSGARDIALGGEEVAAGAGIAGGAVVAGAGLGAIAAIVNQQARIAAEPDVNKKRAIAEAGDRGAGEGSAAGGNALMEALINWLKKDPPKTTIVLESKEPGFKLKPKAGDSPRDPRHL